MGSIGTNEVFRSVLDLIKLRVREDPDHPAISIESRKVTYSQLDEASSRIADILVGRGVRQGDFVPVLATRSIEMVACFLGVLKAGACYVPIDIEAWSAERIAWTLDVVPAHVLVNLGHSKPQSKHDVIDCKQITGTFGLAGSAKPNPTSSDYAVEQNHAQQPRAQQSDLAYMIFTSGTTSTPKGVMISHASLSHYAQQGDEETPFNCNAKADDSVLLIFSPGFDASVGVIFSALCNGAQLIVSTPHDLLDAAARSTILVATPSVLAALGDPGSNFHAVRSIILGGEAPPASLIRKWWTPNRNIYNSYGLTETTIMSLISRINPEQPIVLGKAMANTRVFLMDGYNESAEYGELCITGPGLAVGYYNNPALTSQKFVLWRGERIYKTGDFARSTEFGLVFAGRADSLVKNRGFLVNLESQVIPTLLAAGASTATAFMYQKQLVAFVTPHVIDILAFRKSLSDSHDSYMVPDQIRAIESLPLTANGKADNRALQQLLQSETDHEKESLEDDISQQNMGLSRMEILKAAVAAATTLPPTQVAEDQSFWELGGNSLAAVRVLSYLRKRHLAIGLKALFDLPNLTAVCAALQDESPVVSDPKSVDDPDVHAGSGTAALSPSSGPMSSLQTKMIQGTLKSPGLNYMVFHIRMPLQPGTLLDTSKLRGAWHQVLQRHTIFRTVFILNEGLQKVEPEINIDWAAEQTTAEHLEATVHLRSLEIHKLITETQLETAETFQPVNALRLITVPGISSVLLISVHHAQVDGWSLSIIFNEVQAALKTNEAAPTPTHTTPTTQFIEAALAQKRQENDPNGLAFWEECLLRRQSTFPTLKLPNPPSREAASESTPAATTASSKWLKTVTTPLHLHKSDLESASARFRAIPSSLVYAAWGLVLSNYTFSNNAGFGVVLSGRNLSAQASSDMESVVGPLLNTVPFKMEFKDAQQTIASCVAAVSGDLMNTIEYQWSASKVMETMSGESISNAMQTIVATEYDVPSINDTWILEHQDLILEFSLTLLIEQDGTGNLQGRILYDEARFAPASISRLLIHFHNALHGLLNPSSSNMLDVRRNLLEEDERAALTGKLPRCTAGTATMPTSACAEPLTLKEALDTTAVKWPDVCALESEQHGAMTYRQLDEASNRLARQLKPLLQAENQEGRVVGVLTDRSMHWIVAIAAVIKAGGICCPLDVTLPVKRIQTIVQTSGASIFLAANSACAAALGFADGSRSNSSDRVIAVDEFLQRPNLPDASPLNTDIQVEDVVYLVFTSGTTGTPKGIPLHNKSILNVIQVPEIRSFAAPGRRHAQLTSAGFDIALVDIFGTLCYGGTLVLRDRSDPFEHLKRVHTTNMTPSVLGSLLPDEYKHLDTITLAGEPVPQSLVDVWAVGRHLRNGYGPSECGPISTTTRLRSGQPVSIGCGLPGLHVYVLDSQQCLVPQGVTGELYISGEQITQGYWRNTSQGPLRHVHNPFSDEEEESSSDSLPRTTTRGQQIMYRTGDLGSWNKDMTLRYVGRIDNQVKVRGFRVELEEVEQAMVTAHLEGSTPQSPRVHNAAAIVVEGEQDEQDHRQLVGFVTPQNVNIAALQAEIATTLPTYMRPSYILALPELPKSQNNKVDRTVLRELAISARAKAASSTFTDEESASGSQTALTPTEELISTIWKELLGLSAGKRIHKSQDFLELGGNSIMMIKAARMIATATGYRVSVALLVRKTVLKDLAEAIDQQAATPSSSEVGDTFSAYVSRAKPLIENMEALATQTWPLSYLERELFHSHHQTHAKSALNTTFHFVIRGRVDKIALVEAFSALVCENPLLRSRYRQDVVESPPYRVITEEVLGPSCYVGNEWSKGKMQTAVDEHFDLARDQLLRVIIWDKTGTGEATVTERVATTEVMIITHHIITDRAAISLMMQWASERYQLLTSSDAGLGKSGQPASAISYLDWVAWLKADARNVKSRKQLQKKLDFWKGALQDIQPLPWPRTTQLRQHTASASAQPCVSTQHLLIPHPSNDASTLTSTSTSTSTLRNIAEYSQRLAVAATALALKAVLGTADVLLALPYMNRDDPATARLLGLLVDRIPLRIRLTESELESADKLLQSVASATQHAIENQVPYSQIQAALSTGGKASPRQSTNGVDPRFIDVLVIYNWQTDALDKSFTLGSDVQVTAVDAGHAVKATGAMFPLVLEFSEQEEGKLVVELEYNSDIIPAQVVEEVGASLRRAVQGLARGAAPGSLI